MASLRVIGLIVIVVGVAFMLLDYLGKNPLFSLFRNSLSQNVIARYLPPGAEPSKRGRKVVILAHYDSARMMIQAAPSLAPYYAQLRRIIRVTMVVLAGLVLLAFAPLPAIAQTILQVLTGIAAVIVFLALLVEIINCVMPYNQGVNCNGSSIGVLYGLAQMLSSGADGASLRKAAARGGQRRAAREGSTRASRAPQGDGGGADERATHGARGERRKRERHGASGEQSLASTARVAQELAAAQHAIPVEQGGPVQGGFPQTMVTERSVQSVADNLVTANPFVSQRPALAEIEEAERQRKEEEEARALREAQEAAQASSGMPDWFTKAKQNAEKNVERKRHDPDEAKVVRSRFADMPVSGRLLKVDPSAGDGMAGAATDAAAAAAAQVAATTTPTAAGATSVAATTPVTSAPTATATPAPATPAPAAPATATATAATPATATTTAATPAPGTSVAPASVSPAASPPATTLSAAPAPTVPPRLEAEPIIRSIPARQQTSVAAGAVAGTAGAASTQAAQVTAKPDFTGLDRQAFSVLSTETGSGDAVIVPSETGVIGIAAGSPAGSPSTASAGSPSTASAGSPSSNLAVAGNLAAGSAPTSTTSAPVANAPFTGELWPSEDDSRAGSLQASLLTGPRSRLRNLPGLSKESTDNIPAQQATLDTELVAKEDLFSTEDSVVSATGAFVPLGTTGVMKPIGEDLLNYHDSGEIYIFDADDTSIAENYSKTGEYSEPELLNIPDSRVKSFFSSVGNRLSGKKKEKLDSSPSSWLGVDKGFNARQEGNQIGSWDHFNEEDDDDNWNGGAYGGANQEENIGAMMDLSQGLMDREVWLVALGANSSKNAGIVNLFANHDSELKNALFINLLGVGAGDLVFTIAEGNYRPVQTDHRMQNLISGAAQSMAIPIGPVQFSAFATDGTETLRRGGRAISLMRLGSRLPVGWRWSDNDVAQLREDNLLDVASLVLETIKNS
jgi:hypothetical protein